jgi:hypothetical protein
MQAIQKRRRGNLLKQIEVVVVNETWEVKLTGLPAELVSSPIHGAWPVGYDLLW